MKLPAELAEGINRQIMLELEASLAYLQMAAYFEERSLDGFGHWMRAQSEEERTHALKFFDFLLHRGAHVELGAVATPKADFSDPIDVFETALGHEQRVSEAIDGLYKTASAAGDAASYSLLQWFLEEQVDEEAAVESILDRLRLIGDDGGALLILDSELGSRGNDA